MGASDADKLVVNTIRVLAADAVDRCQSGHPGAPMGMAPAGHVLFNQFLKFNPKNPEWKNRDRFVLSNGHASILLYSLLHLYGYDLSMQDLLDFRQMNSKTPGHPEANHGTPGVEVTTGPLGQGICNAVGLAMAEAHMAATYNRPGYEIFNNYTYCFLGDGCLMEGVSGEASSLAGHLKLGKLIAIYDDNHISIDGDINCAFTEDVAKRYEAYGWHVLSVADGDHDFESIAAAIQAAKEVTDKPSLIKVRSTIGYGSLTQGSASVHGSTLKKDDIAQLKTKFGFNPNESFVVPQAVYDLTAKKVAAGVAANEEWQALYAKYAEAYPAEYAEIERRFRGELPAGWEKNLPTYKPADGLIATRKLSEMLLDKIAPAVPELVGGSADLTGSNLTRWGSAVDFQHPSTGLGDYTGRYIRYGIREHAMGAINNGLVAYGSFISYGGTFLNFVSYGAGALRLSALSKLRTIWVASHDSIALGEDGPTHQPIEVLAHFRALPNCNVWRPADGNETSAAYYGALTAKETPSLLSLSRQILPQLENTNIESALKGAYVLHEDKEATVTLVATGSEVATCLDAVKILAEKHNVKARVVSMPCQEVFDQQPFEYRLSVLPDGIPTLSVEVMNTMGWERYSHEHFGLNRFGTSAPPAEVFAKFDFVPEGVVKRALLTIDFWKDVPNIRSPLRRAFEQVQ